ncbi:MAG: hypothetical protein M1579_05680 [Gammaproteobacteria bacterium]|nr:hypothetical protein [Gammaproteobacteria bacterium]
MQEALKPILLTALVSGQLDHSLANAIAVAAGIDLTDAIDPVKTADDLLHIGRQLYQIGSIDHAAANAFEQVANSIFEHLNQFKAA